MLLTPHWGPSVWSDEPPLCRGCGHSQAHPALMVSGAFRSFTSGGHRGGITDHQSNTGNGDRSPIGQYLPHGHWRKRSHAELDASPNYLLNAKPRKHLDFEHWASCSADALR